MEENRKLDDFITKSIKEVGFEQPSENFTEMVMSKIKMSAEKSRILVYQPLISKKSWAGILTLVALVFAYLIFAEPEFEAAWLTRLNALTTFNLSGNLPDISVSSTLVYAVLIGTFFVLLQVYMIKHYFDRRYRLG